MQYEYFFNVLKEENIDYVLDPLTKLINKNNFKDFIDFLISDNTPPFTLGLIDLDNFHFIVDNYGTNVGDDIVIEIANELSDFIGDNGVVGRVGGDEFVFIYFDLVEYDEIHNMLDELYKKVLRKTIRTYGISILVTGTTGTSSYPKDATSTKDLIEVTNKALYRGKMKGRNCYIIYVEEKHKDIKIVPLGASDIFKIVFNLREQYNSNNGTLLEKLTQLSHYTKKSLNIPFLIYIDNDNKVYNLDMEKMIGKFNSTINLDRYSAYEFNTLDDLRANQTLFDILAILDIKSLFLYKTKNHGYLIFADKKNKYWNPNEKAVLFYIGELIDNEK